MRMYDSQLISYRSLGLFIIRIALAIVFINAAYLKLIDMNMTVNAFASLGFPAIIAYYVTLSELFGGIAFLLGIATRLFALAMVVNMAVATVLLSPQGFSLAQGGYEYTLTLMLVSLALFMLGPGRYSLAHLFALPAYTS